jgi:alginate O-acetyltransferase complex protein AlgI
VLFNSLSFLVFFVGVFAVYQLPFDWRLKKAFVLVVSYVFYAAWNPAFLLLLWLSTLADWFAGNFIHGATTPRRRKRFLLISLGANLLPLLYFKYAEFILGTLAHGSRWLGIPFDPALPAVTLPIGISFYTFHGLSYTLDVYFKTSSPAKSFLDYALYVTFFPHLVAGPILRASHFLPQLEQPKRANASQLGWGIALFSLGIFQKNALADTFLAPIAARWPSPGRSIATSPATRPAPSVWL